MKSLSLLWLVRAALWLRPLPKVQALCARFGAARKPPTTVPVTTSQVVQSVELASLFVPRATCLVKALVAQVRLARLGCAAELRIGVRRSAEGKIEAHAWLESDGRVIYGGGEVPFYAPLENSRQDSSNQPGRR